MSNTNKLITLTLLAFITLNGCGGGSSSTVANTGKQPTVDAIYTLNGTVRPTCHNADNIGELNPSPGEFVYCDWYCAKYQGSDTVQVSLTFTQTPNTEEGIWELIQEDIYEATPDICKDI